MPDDNNMIDIGGKLINIARTVDSLDQEVNRIGGQNERIEETVNRVREDLSKLTEEFRMMVEDQRKTAMLQKAISELVRVRQEIGQKYGNYSVTRETMLGVLQATDAALVKKTTISRVSEELMLSTPQYWLAPCLVAVSAWISNDRELAERAIAEAMKRDEEKTSLCMALICRRNGRIQTGYEWLSIYFSNQNAASITEETFTYIDAYVNGIFGPDDKHMCQGYVAKWIDEIRGNRSNFEASQEQKWEEYCERFKIDARKMYPELAESSPDFAKINTAISAVNSFGAIRENFKGITEAFVDQEAMKKTIDSELIRMISNYDKSEVDIRREEEYLTLVKFYEGDEEKAKKEMLLREAKRQQHKLDVIEQMASEITSDRETAPSKRRTAVTFLSNYINRGYTRYVDSAKSSFPKTITLNVNQWSGESKDGSNIAQLCMDYERKMNEVREEAIKRSLSANPKVYLILAIVFFVLGVAAVAWMPARWFIGAAIAALGGVLLLSRQSMLKNSQKSVARINEEFDEIITVGKIKLDASLKQWRDARETMTQYENEGEHTVA